MLAVEGRGIVVDGDTWNEVPVPDSGYIFVLIALEVCVNDAVGEMETKKLQGMSMKILIWGGGQGLTFCEFVHSVFRVLVEYILRDVT